MQDFNITVSKSTGEVWLNQYTIGRDSENLQKNFVFGFSDEFVNGQARLEMSIDGQDSWITLTKDNDNETYYVPIQSAVTKCGKIFMQLVITEGEIEEGIPIFKSNVFYVFVDESINAEIEQPEEYPTWIEIANEKLNEMDNLDIDATKAGDTATITITKKDGTEQSVEIKDGQDGQDGQAGEDGVGLDYNWSGTSLGIKREDETNYTYTDLKGPKGDPGSIKMRVVQTLPATGDEDTIYLVPSTDPTTQNLYDEYIYTNNAWEKIGNTSVDLSDYATKEDVEITIGGETFYTNQTWADFLFESLQSAFDNIDGELDRKEDKTNKVTSLSSSSTDTEYPSAKAVYDALQGAGGDSVYLGLNTDFTQQNPLDLNSLDVGVYTIGTIENSSENVSINLKATINGVDYTNRINIYKSNRQTFNNIYVLRVVKRIDDMTFSPSTENFGYLSYLFISSSGSNYFEYKSQHIDVQQNGIFVSTSYNTNMTLMDTNNTQYVSGKKIFTTLPETDSGLTPTTDYQLVNKKYVDDNAGGGTSPFGPPISWDMMLSTNNPTTTNYPTIFEQIRLAYNYSIENNLEDSIGLINSGSNVSFNPSRLLGFYTAKKGSKQFYCVFLHTPYKSQSSKIASLSYVNIDLSRATFDSSGKITTMISSFRISPMLFGLATDNQIAYTPTNNYNPATKKYVDDSIASAITTTLGGSY